MRLKPIVVALAATNMMFSLPQMVYAEEANVNEEVKEEAKHEDEHVVIVTATKRDTDLMETPIAISVFSEEELDKLGIKNVKDMNNLVPNMSIMVDNESSAPIITLRGVRSTNTTEWGDPAVGIHYDGIYSPRPQGALSLMFDTERVEVMRGPQGTLFGRNSTVGSMNIISSKPRTDKFLGSAQVEAGRWNQKAFKGMLNLPVTDNFAIRAAFATEKQDSNFTGYYDPNQWDQRYLDLDYSQLTPVEQTTAPATRDWAALVPFADTYYEEVLADPEDFYNNKNNYSFRISSLWIPRDDMSWQFSFERYRDNSAGGIFGRDCERIANRPSDVNGGSCTDIWGDEDNFTAYVNIPGKNDMVLDSYRSRFEYDITPDMQMVYLAGYQSQERTGQIDLDQGYYFWDQMLKWVDTDYDSYSHEINLKSTDGGPFQWITGYFKFKESNYMNGQYHGAMGGVALWLQPKRTVESEAVFGQATYEFQEDMFFTFGVRHTKDTKQDIGGRNYGCWGACYVADAWGTVDWGALFDPDSGYDPSWQRDELNALPADFYDYPDMSLADWNIDTENDVKNEWSATTYRIGFDWQYDVDTLLYFYVADGYKGGGNGDVLFKQSDGTRFDTSYDEETVTTYELGVKTSVLDGSLDLMANYFYSDYKGQQFTQWTIFDHITVQEFDPDSGQIVDSVQDLGTFLTRNAANSMIQGLELEANWEAWENGKISGWVTFLDTEITSDYWKNWGTEINQVFANVDTQDFDPENPRPWQRNLKGNELPYSPKMALTINVSHTFNFDSGATLTPFLNFHWEDESYVGLDNTDKWNIASTDLNENIDLAIYSDKRDSWSMATFNLNYTSADKSWFGEAYVYNLTDEDVNWWQGYAGTTPIAVKAQRNYGLRFGYNF
ncbi:TonB-dependent receptor [Aliikangiella sp. G2MR2-5]|uniref:TonB-dependent receptor n=1 Tax=Aliikangiella sp. G2MR2-5 TaxID=2788943 RepID=UPI0018ABBECC|nr:TonB-dependent receptor [Aliikangiella sp. G2MR2-5]